jgi:hypothetical protein
MVFKMNKAFLHVYNLDVCQSSNGQGACNSRLFLHMTVGVTHTHTRVFLLIQKIQSSFFSLQITLH